MDKGPWYNTDICTKLNDQISEEYFKTGHKDRHNLMCFIDANDKEQVPMPDYASSGGGRPMPSTSSKNHFSHLVTQSTLLTIGFNNLRSIIRT